MSDTLPGLEAQRSKVLRQITELGDLRPGSITSTIRRCGKPTCHCARAGDPGHGPNLRLTFKTEGKTVTEALPTASAVRKTEREIEEFRKFQKLSHIFVQLSEKICRLRPVEEGPAELLTPQERSWLRICVAGAAISASAKLPKCWLTSPVGSGCGFAPLSGDSGKHPVVDGPLCWH